MVKEAVEQAKQQRWVEDVSAEDMARAERGSKWTRLAATLCVFLPLILGLSHFGPQGAISRSLPDLSPKPPVAEQDKSLPNIDVEVTPGNVEIEKGSRLVINAVFGAKSRVPVEAKLAFGPEEASFQTMPMVKDLEDPLFGVIMPEVNDDFVYQVQFGEQQTELYTVTTFEYPRLDRANVTITPPSFVGGEPKTMQDVRQVTAYKESELVFELMLNKAVAKIKLVDEKTQAEVPVVVSEDDPSIYTATLAATESQILALTLEDAEKRPSKQAAKLEITVLVNEPPEVAAVFPKKDISASPLEEVTLQGKADDDFGIINYGMSYTFMGNETEVPLGKPEPPVASVGMENMIALEELKAEEDQLLSYYFWAEDKDSDGNVRRAKSDIYFIEMRPFLKRYP